jgi:integrase
METIIMQNTSPASAAKRTWNKGRIIGQKPPLKLPEVWAIRIRLELKERCRDLALFNLAIDSKLRGCDLVKLRVFDVAHGASVLPRALIVQQKTKMPVQFEITEQTRTSVGAWIESQKLQRMDYLFPSRVNRTNHLSTRQYARLVESWVAEIGLDPNLYGTHSLRRTKPTLVYRRTKNLRAVQLLLGHTKLDYLPPRTMSRCHRIGWTAVRWCHSNGI